MIPALRFLWALRDRGVRLWAEDGHLQYDAPEGVITAEDRAQVPVLKAGLLRLLTERCACGPCSEGEEPHGHRCYCPACRDADRAAASADAEYEVAEREAIQAEGCTAAELEAIRKPNELVATTAATGLENQGPPSERPGPWSWTDPENTREDLAILRSIERLDREETRETAESSCYGCGGRDWWRARIGGHLVCRRCHPPVAGAEATP